MTQNAKQKFNDIFSTFFLQSVWVVTWLAVVILNVEMGLMVGVVFSMMTVVCRTQRYTVYYSNINVYYCVYYAWF